MRRRTDCEGKCRRADRKRHFFQLIFMALLNGYAAGFSKGAIFTGKTKGICVPVLNCYSCPGAFGACPIGSLQSAFASGSRFGFYVLGTIMLFGIVLGRLICGFLCPFGLIQDLLHKIPVKKFELPEKIDKPARFVKYAILLFMVVLLPLVYRNSFGIGETFFCKYLCPAGTLEAGIPLLIKNDSLRLMIGALFDWKIAVLIVIILWSVFSYRPFCRYFCPLGAFYGLFNRFSLYRYEFDREKCTGCGSCKKVCGMKVDVAKNCNSSECIRCGRCKAVCPTGAIKNAKPFGKSIVKEKINEEKNI